MVLAIVVIAVPMTSQAFNSKSGESVLWEGETSGNFYAAGTTVDVAGVINGDVFVAGQVITISGDVRGDVFAAGNNIIIRGNVEGNVRAMGSVIDIQGKIGKNVLAAGNSLVVNSMAEVGRHLTFAGNVLKIDGPIGGNLETSVNNLTINNKISGSADIEVVNESNQPFKITNNAEITGDLVYKAISPAEIASGAKILGETNYKPLENRTNQKSQMMAAKWNKNMKDLIGFGMLVKFLSSFLVGLLLILLMPKLVTEFNKTMQANFWKNFGRGVLWLFMVPVIVIFLMFTLIGISVALIGLVLYFIGLYLAGILAAIVIGRLITNAFKWQKLHLLFSFLIGLILISLVGCLPVIGWLATWVLCMWAFGTGIKMKLEMLKNWK